MGRKILVFAPLALVALIWFAAPRTQAQPSAGVRWEYLELYWAGAEPPAAGIGWLRQDLQACRLTTEGRDCRKFDTEDSGPPAQTQPATPAKAFGTLGLEGWELVTVLEGTVGTVGDARTWIFKRPVGGR